MPIPSSAHDVDVCILGAGPHGLAAAIHLERADPTLDVVAVDPSGEWLTGWREQFARAEIEVLRSPIVHHPGTGPYELTDYINEANAKRSGLPYDPPRADVFSEFCGDLIEDEELAPPIAGTINSVTPDGDEFVVVTDRAEIRATHLVVATNPHRRTIPDWVSPLLGEQPGLFAFGSDVDLRTMDDMAGERVAIIGAGMTAAHLAVGAATRGADTHLITRRPIVVRDFDTEPGWLGPRYLLDFSKDEDPASRRKTILDARGGGTIPPWLRTRLDGLAKDGPLVLHQGSQVKAVTVDDEGSLTMVLGCGDAVTADRVWLATGTMPDIEACRYLADLAADVPVVDGLPVTDDTLRLGQHRIYLMGRLTGLNLGPASGNIWGAQRAANRITLAITGVDLQHESVVSMA